MFFFSSEKYYLNITHQRRRSSQFPAKTRRFRVSSAPSVNWQENVTWHPTRFRFEGLFNFQSTFQGTPPQKHFEQDACSEAELFFAASEEFKRPRRLKYSQKKSCNALNLHLRRKSCLAGALLTLLLQGAVHSQQVSRRYDAHNPPPAAWSDIPADTTALEIWHVAVQDPDLSSEDLQHLTNLEGITLRNVNLRSIAAGTFQGLANLTRIEVQRNPLSRLVSGSFSGLNQLSILKLQDNEISTLESDVFTGLTNLLELNLYGNQISSIPASVFTGLTNLGVLYLDNNQISSIPPSVFTGLTNLGVLYLNNNQISSIPASVFTGLTSLQRLHLNNNQISSIPPSVFTGLTSLVELWLNNNQISSVERGTFAGLPLLSQLHLSWNRLETLEFIFNPEDFAATGGFPGESHSSLLTSTI